MLRDILRENNINYISVVIVTSFILFFVLYLIKNKVYSDLFKYFNLSVVIDRNTKEKFKKKKKNSKKISNNNNVKTVDQSNHKKMAISSVVMSHSTTDESSFSFVSSRTCSPLRSVSSLASASLKNKKQKVQSIQEKSELIKNEAAEGNKNIEKIKNEMKSSVINKEKKKSVNTDEENKISKSHKIKKFKRTAQELNGGIADLYDSSTFIWEKIWGDHLHHGYYEVGKKVKNNQEAQIKMIERALQFFLVQIPEIQNKKSLKKKRNIVEKDLSKKYNDQANRPIMNSQIQNMLDVGCGLGGSSRYICKKFNCKSTAITLSSYQKKRAEEITAQEGLSDKCKFLLCDAMDMNFEYNSFDLVWLMESAEHIAPKELLIRNLLNVCKPGGIVCIVTWCHRNLKKTEKELKENEQRLLDKICKYYFLPEWWSLKDYVNCFKKNGCLDIRYDDWTANVQPFWSQVLWSIFSFKSFYYLIINFNWQTIKSLFAVIYMIRGYKKGVVKLCIVTARKKA